jgi:hypothetical protein
MHGIQRCRGGGADMTEEQKYLKAACRLCAAMYENGCKGIVLTIEGKQQVVDTAEVIIYLAGKAGEVDDDECN